MKVFRVTFAANQVASIKPAEPTFILTDNEDYYYESGGTLIYALVKAATEEEAMEKSLAIIEKVKRGSS